jgi:hypothetical protein
MKIINLTPHTVTLYTSVPEGHRWVRYRDGGPPQLVGATSVDYPTGGPAARVVEDRGAIDWIGDPPNRVPVRGVRFQSQIEGLPAPERGTMLIVSLPVIEAARRSGRPLFDLMTVGDIIRDDMGAIRGCTCFHLHSTVDMR